MATSRPTPRLDLILDPEGDTWIVLTTDAILEERRTIAEKRAEKQEHELTEYDRIPLQELVPGGDVRYLVSSTILKHNSPVFRLFFRKDGLHEKLLSENGSVEFVDEDVNPQAFSHFLDAFYNNYHNVPGFGNDVHLDFDTWVEVMVILDKYDFHRAATLYKAAWWQLFSRHLPANIGEYIRGQKDRTAPDFDLRAWISVCHVMQKRDELDRLLQIYKLFYTPFDDAEYDLPLPPRLEMAERQRLAAFESVNKILKAYHDSAVQWSMEAVCRCNKLQVARRCDRDVLEKLTKSFKQYGWLAPPKRMRNATTNTAAIQIDPSRVTFNDLRTRIPKMKNFPHHCNEVMAKEISAKALKSMQREQQEQKNAVDPFMMDAHTFDMPSDWQQMLQSDAQPPISSNLPYGYNLTCLPSNPQKSPTQVAKQAAKSSRQMGTRGYPAQLGRPRQPPLPTQNQPPAPPYNLAGTYPNRSGYAANRPASTYPPALTIPGLMPRPNSTFPQSTPQQLPIQQIQVFNQARAQAQRNSQQVHGYMFPTNTHPMSLNQMLTTSASAISPTNDSFDFDFDMFQATDDDLTGFVDSAVDLGDDLGLFGQISTNGNGSGNTSASPIDLDFDEAETDKPIDIMPCNPSPFQTIVQRVTQIEEELKSPVPDYVPMEPVEIVEVD